MTSSAPNLHPLRVGVVLAEFTTEAAQQYDLFEAAAERHENIKLHGAIDGINKKYGYGTIGFGEIRKSFLAFNGRIAFQRVPTMDDF